MVRAQYCAPCTSHYLGARSVDGAALARAVERAASDRRELALPVAPQRRGTRRPPQPHRMTRIGLAYNQKPASEDADAGQQSEAPRADEEPPSSESVAPQSATTPAGSLDDAFAEWDAPAT